MINRNGFSNVVDTLRLDKVYLLIFLASASSNHFSFCSLFGDKKIMCQNINGEYFCVHLILLLLLNFLVIACESFFLPPSHFLPLFSFGITLLASFHFYNGIPFLAQLYIRRANKKQRVRLQVLIACKLIGDTKDKSTVVNEVHVSSTGLSSASRE